MNRFIWLVILLSVLVACATPTPTPTATKPPAPTALPAVSTPVPTATSAPRPTNTAVPTAVPTVAPTATSAPTATRTSVPTAVPTAVPTVMQYTYTVNEEQFNEIANNALSPSVVMYADNARVKLQDGQITISANYYPPNVKPSFARLVLTARANSCKPSISIVGASFGYSSLPPAQQATFRQLVEQRLTYILTQQRPFTCIDSITVGGGIMTIKYR